MGPWVSEWCPSVVHALYRYLYKQFTGLLCEGFMREPAVVSVLAHSFRVEEFAGKVSYTSIKEYREARERKPASHIHCT